MRVVKASLGVAMLGSVLFGGSVALSSTASSTPVGGSVEVFATPTGTGGTIVVTGAIGDYGKTRKINKNGKPDSKGKYTKVTLQKGTFEINGTRVQAMLAKAQPTLDKATCSGLFSGTAPVSLFDGTGLYKRITGTLKVTFTFAFIPPRYASGKHKGQCNLSDSAQPIAEYSSIRGTGTVKFS